MTSTVSPAEMAGACSGRMIRALAAAIVRNHLRNIGGQSPRLNHMAAEDLDELVPVFGHQGLLKCAIRQCRKGSIGRRKDSERAFAHQRLARDFQHDTGIGSGGLGCVLRDISGHEDTFFAAVSLSRKMSQTAIMFNRPLAAFTCPSVTSF